MCEGKQREDRIVQKNEEAVLIDLEDGIGQICFLSKGNSLSPLVRAFLREVLERDAYGFQGLIIANQGKNFSVGADLTAFRAAIEQGDYGNPSVMNGFQEIQEKIKTYHKPIVAAPFKNVLGGGLELCLHCHARVALHKLYMGLVEVGIGLLPGGGGLKESALLIGHASEDMREALLLGTFEKLMLRSVSKSAEEAREMHYLKPEDQIVEEPEELIPAAKAKCLELLKSFAPASAGERVTLGGKRDFVKLMALAEQLLAEKRISPYDLEIAKRIARVLAGSDTEDDVVRTGQELFILENRGMWELKQQAGTYARICNFLDNGSMLRN